MTCLRCLSPDEVALLRNETIKSDVIRLAELLGFDPGVMRRIDHADEHLDVDRLLGAIDGIFSNQRCDRDVASLVLLTNDPTGMSMLACFLRCAVITRQRYMNCHIDDEVYVATMRFFPRFVEGYRMTHKDIRFDQEFWTPRLIAMRLFRIDELEFELLDGERCMIGVHIPSDAVLSATALYTTFLHAHSFLRAHYPRFADAVWCCDSWMLDPALESILPDNSHIRFFRSLFNVVGLQYSDDYKRWIYGRTDIESSAMPMKTSLQRNVRQLVLSGVRMGVGYGEIRNDAIETLKKGL